MCNIEAKVLGARKKGTGMTVVRFGHYISRVKEKEHGRMANIRSA
ncbi:hypothetical protein [Wolbachia endosymbiont of Atemnus politus]|nr:hypothetical protein [Wolbachia endosymbiont of Atemnus politus]